MGLEPAAVCAERSQIQPPRSPPPAADCWFESSHCVGRSRLHSVSAVSVSAAKTAYPPTPSSFPNRDPLRRVPIRVRGPIKSIINTRATNPPGIYPRRVFALFEIRFRTSGRLRGAQSNPAASQPAARGGLPVRIQSLGPKDLRGAAVPPKAFFPVQHWDSKPAWEFLLLVSLCSAILWTERGEPNASLYDR